MPVKFSQEFQRFEATDNAGKFIGQFNTFAEAQAAIAGTGPQAIGGLATEEVVRGGFTGQEEAGPLTIEQKAKNEAAALQNELFSQGVKDLNQDGKIDQEDVRLQGVALGTGTSAGGTATEFQTRTETIGTGAGQAQGAQTVAFQPAETVTPEAGLAPRDTTRFDEFGRAIGTQLPTTALVPSSASQAEAGAPQFDTTRVDETLARLNEEQAFISGLAREERDFDKAEAFLDRAGEEARLAALGQARGGRSRGDRALLERQAIGEGAAISQGVTRQAAELRADQEEADRQFRLDASVKAGELGLNAAVLEVDIGGQNLDSANQFLTRELQAHLGDRQLTIQETENMMGFMRDMALIEQDYNQMTSDEQIEADKRLTERYGIDQSTLIELKRLALKEGEGGWLGFIKKAALGALPVVAAAVVSDERVKTDIAAATADELEELLAAVKPSTFEFKDPERGEGPNFGLMAQDLEQSAVGASMVGEGPGGVKQIDTGKLASAAVSGLSMVNDRLKRLEEMLQ